MPQVPKSVYSTKLKKKTHTHKNIPCIIPVLMDSLSQLCVENHGAHPTSSVMDHPLMHISRFPRAYRGEEQMAVVERRNRTWNVPGGLGIKGQPSSSGSVGSVSGGRTEIPHALKQLSSMLQLLSP